TVNDETCQVIPHGRGPLYATTSPFAPEYDHGDSEAFVAKRAVEVEVTTFNGNSTCTIQLYNIATANEVNFKKATHENPIVTLDPGPARNVYVSDPSC